MLSRYFNDGLLQIAILLSLFRTDLIHLNSPNNDLFNYPEVQDILQGQTVAYQPINFHNLHNTLNSFQGYSPAKHIDNDFHFSSLFNGLSQFRRRISTNIEAFLVSGDTSAVTSTQTSHQVPPETDSNSNNAVESTTAGTGSQLDVSSLGAVDSNHNAVCADNDFFTNPFPGTSLSKEDLDLIEVLWRQDADLGVGKEVFDPNLRRELEHEREVELRKEQEKRKEAEKRERERQQQNQQWLLDNFFQDGETGEWLPIARPETATFPSSESVLYPDTGTTEPCLVDGLCSFSGEGTTNHTYVQPFPEQNLESLLSQTLTAEQENAPTTADFSSAPLSDLAYPLPNYDDERLEKAWQDLVAEFPGLQNPSVPSSMPPVATTTPHHPNTPTNASGNQPQAFATNVSHASQPLYSSNASFVPPSYLHQQLQGDLATPDPGLNASSAAASMTETRRLLRQNSSASEAGSLGSLNLTQMLRNVTLPVPVDNATVLPHFLDLAPENGYGPQELGGVSAGGDSGAEDAFDCLDWEGSDLLLNNLADLANLTESIDTTALLPDLSASTLDVSAIALDPHTQGMECTQLVDDNASDSAISMGSGSPQQGLYDSMNLSPFDGLEGATGGSDYDSRDYGHKRSYSHSSGGFEEDPVHYSTSSYGSPASVSTNSSGASNDTDHSSSSSPSSARSSGALQHMRHNHTYNTQPGQLPREVKKYAKRDASRQKGPHSRDAKLVEDYKLPISFEDIIKSPVEEFNEMQAKYKLTEAQLTLMRDVRRRGKNKVAAQNCRKRKMEVLTDLEDELGSIQRARDKARCERQKLLEQRGRLADKTKAMEQHILQALRDDQGRPYDPARYALQYSSDGNVFVVPTECLANFSSSSSSSSSAAAAQGHKDSDRKSKDNGRQHKKKSKE